MTRTLRRWAIAAIVVPLIGWGLTYASQKVAESRGDDSKVAKGLGLGGTLLRRA